MKKVVSLKKGMICFLCTGIFSVIAFWFSGQYFYGPDMVISTFKEVETFTRDISLLSTVDRGRIIQTNLTQKSDLSSICVDQNLDTGDGSYSPYTTFAITPDNSRFYVFKRIFVNEYDNKGQLLRRLAMPEFDLNSYKYCRIEKALASHDKLGVLLSFGTNVHCKDVFIKWQINDQIPVPEVLPIDPDNNGDPFCEHGFILDSQDNCSVFDNVSLSSLSKMDLAQKTKNDIISGQAKWASDRYIYFIRKATQLWRVKPGFSPEAVYKSTGFARERDMRFSRELVFDTDRTCLAFCYRVPVYESNESVIRDNYTQMFGAVSCGVVIIDLKTNEYLHMPANTFYYIYRELHAKGLLHLRDEIYLPLQYKDHFWHIENMALIVKND